MQLLKMLNKAYINKIKPRAFTAVGFLITYDKNF